MEVQSIAGTRRLPLVTEITLLCVSGVRYEASLFALWKSQRNAHVGRTVFVSPTRPTTLPKGIVHEFPFESELKSIDEYSRYMVYEAWRHVNTSHCLVVQWDGYVLNWKNWTSQFLEWDYIGAPWPIREDAYIDPFGSHVRVGNGGFSLRSRNLMTLPSRVPIEWDVNKSSFYKHMNAGSQAEDGIICVHNRHIYEDHGCRFAPLEIAAHFSHENSIREHSPKRVFGFHKHFPNRKLQIRNWVSFQAFRQRAKCFQ